MLKIYLLCLCCLSAPVRAQEPEPSAMGQLQSAAEQNGAQEVPQAPKPALVAKLFAVDDPWSRIKNPASGPAEPIGSYDAGCLQGAQKLPSKNPGYEIMRPKRHKYYGHPDMITFIETMAQQAQSAGFGDILIGDVGQPRGGPSLTGHASHQTGLDVDIWLWQPPKGTKLTLQERNTLSAPRMVVPDFERLTKNWRPQMIEPLKLAAEYPRTERIFVNPVVKREVCKTYKGQPWVQKLRPWWSHNEHFHVRLRCPDNSPECKDQEPIPPGDGCDATLDEWFTPEKKAEARYKREHPEPPKMPELPPACQQVLNSK